MPETTRLSVIVTPRANRARVQLKDDGVVHVWVTAAPADNAANEAVVRALADALDVPKSEIRIVRGATSRTKVIEVPLSETLVNQRLPSIQ